MANMLHDRDKKSVWQVLRHIDILLLASTVSLTVIGIAMVYSVTKAQHTYLGVTPDHYVIRQFGFAIVGISIMAVLLFFDYRHFEELGIVVYVAVVIMLVGVLSNLGTHVLGGQRWFQFGPIQIQPSEFALLAVILLCAYILSKSNGVGFKVLIFILAVMSVPMLLVYMQPDLGTAIIIGVSLLVMLVASGLRVRYILLLLGLLVFGVFLILHFGILKPFQVERLTAFLHPKNAPAGTVYNLQQSENAIGAGGLLGQGYGHGAQTNLAFVPEQQTDFIFTAVGEQLGFLGTASVVALYSIMAWRLMRAILLARDQYGRTIAAGTLGVISFSAFQNIGMTLGIMPITGIPLPFMSSGGSAMVVFFALIGLVLNVEMRRLQGVSGQYSPMRRGEELPPISI